jgi:hypothetical protein
MAKVEHEGGRATTRKGCQHGVFADEESWDLQFFEAKLG